MPLVQVERVSPAPNPVQGSAASISQAFTVPVGSNCSVAHVTWDGANVSSITAITYGGDTMTEVIAPVDNTAGSNNSAHNKAGQYTRTATKTGSNTLAVTFSVSTEFYCSVVGYKNVRQSEPVLPGSGVVNTFDDNSDAAGLRNVVVPSGPAHLSVMTFMAGGQSLNGTTQFLDGTINVLGILSMGVDHASYPAASVTHGWSSGTGGVNGAIFSGFSLQAEIPGLPDTDYSRFPVPGMSRSARGG